MACMGKVTDVSGRDSLRQFRGHLHERSENPDIFK